MTEMLFASFLADRASCPDTLLGRVMLKVLSYVGGRRIRWRWWRELSHSCEQIRERLPVRQAGFPQWYEKKPIVCLYIEDIYDYMQPELIAVLKEKFEDVYRRGLLSV
jgi:hypothetical protein